MSLSKRIEYYNLYKKYLRIETDLKSQIGDASSYKTSLHDDLMSIHNTFIDYSDTAIGLIKDKFDAKEINVFMKECNDVTTAIDEGIEDAQTKIKAVTDKKNYYYGLYLAEAW